MASMDAGELLTEGQSSQTMNSEKAIRSGLLKGRVVWFGGINDWKKDWLFYVENEHTLISMWRGHALHPFERFDRGCYFFCVVCFSLFETSYVAHNYPISDNFQLYCLAVTISSALLVVYDYFLRFIAVMPCVQSGGSCYTACWLCRDCCRDMGQQGLYVCVAGSIGFLIAGIVLAATSSSPPGTFFLTFLFVKVASYLAEFPPLAYFFYSARESQRESWQNGGTSVAYPLGPSYPTREYLLGSRHSGIVDPWARDAESGGRRRAAPSNDGDPPRPSRHEAMLTPQVMKDRQERRDRAIELLHKARSAVNSQSSTPPPRGGDLI